MLTLPIKKQWFDMILKGEKKEEYRAEKPYYRKRFQTVGLLDKNGVSTLNPTVIALRNGYSASDPTLYVRVVMKHGYGKKEWGAEENVAYYCLAIDKVLYLEINGKTVWRNIDA